MPPTDIGPPGVDEFRFIALPPEALSLTRGIVSEPLKGNGSELLFASSNFKIAT
jgi:hypothetical protein